MQEQEKTTVELVDRQMMRLSGVHNVDIFDEEKIKNFNKCVIVFAFHGEEYTDKEIKKIFDKYIVKFNDILNSKASIELISFPIISKEELKNEISRQVTIHYDNS